MIYNLTLFLTPLFLSILLTPVILFLCNRQGLFKRPSDDRWHKKSIPSLGGIGIFLSFFPVQCWYLVSTGLWEDYRFLGILGASVLIFIVGLLDDLITLKPYMKLLGQLIAALVVIGSSTIFNAVPFYIAFPLTLVWIIGVTNAFNLLDNMDGLSSGIAFITLGMLGAFSFFQGNETLVAFSMIFAGAVLGFLVYNFPPAKIFMGDSGSLLIGFNVAVYSVLGSQSDVANTFLTLLIPISILAIPIFDTALVTITRLIRGISIAQGGKDHISHRMVILGLSERRTVGILYLLTAVSGLACLTFYLGSPVMTVCLILLVFAFLFYLGKFLGNASVTDTTPGKVKTNMVAIPLLMHKKKIIEMLIDIMLLGAAFVLSFYFVFNGNIPISYLTLIESTIAMVLIVKILSLAYAKIYKILWEYHSILNYLTILKSVAVSSLIIITMLFFTGQISLFPPLVFFLDFMLSVLFLSGVKVLECAFNEYFQYRGRKGRRVLIYGAGAAGVMLLREIRSNKLLNYNIRGFLDDDKEKLGKVIHKVPVIGNLSDIETIKKDEYIDMLLVAIPALSGKKGLFERVQKTCNQQNIRFLIMHDFVESLI